MLQFKVQAGAQEILLVFKTSRETKGSPGPVQPELPQSRI